LNQELQKKESTESQPTEFNPSKLSQNNKNALNEEIKSRIEQRITRSMAYQNREQATLAIAVINNLIIPDSEKSKLKTIAKKIYQSIQLTIEETSFWN
jgi:hypothetical protein